MPVRLHRDVTVDLRVTVAAEGEVIIGHLTPEEEAAILAKPEVGETKDEPSEAESATT